MVENRPAPDHPLARLFLAFWVLAFYLEFSESRDDLFWMLVAGSLVVIALGIRHLRLAWLICLSVIMARLIWKLPLLSNHANFVLIMSIYLWREGWRIDFPDPSRWRSNLLVGLGLVYLIAGVHKLNTDFFDPVRSCVTFFTSAAGSRFAGAGFDLEFIPIRVVAAIVIALELILGILVLWRRTFMAGAVGASLFHLLLAPLGFVDFSAVAFAILALGTLALLPIKREDWSTVFRHFRFAILLMLMAGGVTVLGPNPEIRRWLYLNQAAVLVILFIILAREVYVRGYAKPSVIERSSVVWPLLILLFGTANYWGLRTAGNFSMFSNLRTEGDVTNHLLIPKDLKIFEYQDQLLEVAETNFVANENDQRHWPRPGFRITELELARFYRDHGQSGYFVRTIPSAPSPGELVARFSWLEYKLMLFRRVARDDQRGTGCYW